MINNPKTVIENLVKSMELVGHIDNRGAYNTGHGLVILDQKMDCGKALLEAKEWLEAEEHFAQLTKEYNQYD